ncbi:Polyadenylate-binding protein 1-B-binding protein [Heracleum sosnowskyi]|uniref:Polyadenylate-binding protein 1-B-binding protein n=1 Tax=Heracleum sosnowskyi TaxID=360622 RepID=A0AAD8N6W7_9APIA|nr:Polyadenylate-binding protein 1-B-binding protein [Heracleum sosnowskyi]
MDRKFQFLGFCGIFEEALNLTVSYRKIFSQITLSIILPLSLIILAQIEISEYLFREIIHNRYALKHTQIGSQRYSKISDILSSQWTTFWLFKISYFIFSLILSLLSTSAVVYTIACIYTEKEIAYKKVMKVVPKVWKRLMVTFIWNSIIAFALIIVLVIGIILWVVTLGPSVIGITAAIIFLLIYFSGLVYISFMWHLAGIVSVLEDVYGIQAMFKSKDLIKGNIGLCAVIFLLDKLCFIGIHLGFKASVVGGNSISGKIWYACLWFMLLSMLIHFALVIQTIIYFICKSYHHEHSDKSSLSDHLEVYGGDYVPLYSKDVQLEHSEV